MEDIPAGDEVYFLKSTLILVYNLMQLAYSQDEVEKAIIDVK